MIVLEKHIVPRNVSGIRFSDYAYKIFTSIPSRKGIKKAIKRGELLVDGEKSETGTWIKPGQRIDLISLDVKRGKNYLLSLKIIYEDEYIAVIDKPAGITVNGNKYKTIENALPCNLKFSDEKDALTRPKPVHRLDSQTSGLLMVAKTASALVKLGQQFETREIKKRYRAVVIGKVPEHGFIDKPINGREASTEFFLVKHVPSIRNTWLSLIDLYPYTGRTHQLRSHMADSGYPILGDKIYGIKGEILRSKGLFLCAVELSLIHPIHNIPIEIKIDEPIKFSTFLDRETRRWLKFKT